MRTLRPCFRIPSYTLAALGAAALFGTTAQAADLNNLPPLTVPVESWTGFSFAVGGGVGIFNTNVNTSAKRKDTLEQCPEGFDSTLGTCGELNADWVLNETFSNSQNLNVNDLGDDGGFGTIELAYDRQFGPNWVLGVWANADLYGGMDATAKQQSTSDNDHIGIPLVGFGLTDFGANSTLTSKTKIGLDWGWSIGGRIGWLATPSTLLYVLGGYNRVELDQARVNVFTDTTFHTSEDINELDGGCLVFGNCPLSLKAKLPNSLDGFTVGGGTEVKISEPWSIKLEYRYSHFNGEKARVNKDSAEAFATIDDNIGLRREAFAKAEAGIDDINLHTVRAMLAYRF